jgi:predicted GNAT superfamily acetyltransferase
MPSAVASDSGEPGIVLRDATAADFAAIVALNAAEVQFTSPMDAARTAQLHAWSWRHRVATVDGEIAAFVLAMRDGSDYDGSNFRWFAARHPRFAYVDRIVVDGYFKGLGLGARMYRDVFAAAAADDLAIVCCEYNLVPANEPSRAFHDRFGFREVGQLDTADGKRVSMQVAALPPPL